MTLSAVELVKFVPLAAVLLLFVAVANVVFVNGCGRSVGAAIVWSHRRVLSVG